jgi:hypothetical protein
MHPMARRLWLLAWLSLLGLLTLYFHGREQPSVTASGDLHTVNFDKISHCIPPYGIVCGDNTISTAITVEA